jgi:isoamylase
VERTLPRRFFTVTVLSAGMPMLLMGDEVRRTQGGNNNAYCQDTEANWFDWGLVAERADVHRFVTLLNRCRLSRDAVHEQQRVSLRQLIRETHVTWHGVKLYEPDWSDASHSIAFTSRLPGRRMVFHVILNAYWEPLDFELPPVVVAGARDHWRRWIDTFLDSPHDIVDWKDAPEVGGWMYRTEPRSVVVLFAPIDAQEY